MALTLVGMYFEAVLISILFCGSSGLYLVTNAIVSFLCNLLSIMSLLCGGRRTCLESIVPLSVVFNGKATVHLQGPLTNVTPPPLTSTFEHLLESSFINPYFSLTN